MTDFELMTDADVELMQGLAQRVAGLRPDQLSADATYGELAWVWGQVRARFGGAWPRRLWFAGDSQHGNSRGANSPDDNRHGGELAAWAWAHLPRELRRNDGSVSTVTNACLAYQVHPDHAAELIDEVIDWYDEVAAGLERTVLPTSAEDYALTRWAARGYERDARALADDGDWHQFTQRDLAGLDEAVLPDGFRFRTAAEAGPEAAVRAHTNAWVHSAFNAQSYADVQRTAAYRGDLHVLVEAPDGELAASTIMWLDAVNETVEFEPVGTHPGYRRLGLARTMMLHGMRLARDAGATHATVACEGAPGSPGPRSLYYGLGFREISRDVPLVKAEGPG